MKRMKYPKELKVRSKSINKWGDQRGTLVTLYKNYSTYCCKEGKDGVEGVMGFGDSPKMAIANFIFRKFYFDGGEEKYYPFVIVES